jgi:hypothetical protein
LGTREGTEALVRGVATTHAGGTGRLGSGRGIAVTDSLTNTGVPVDRDLVLEGSLELEQEVTAVVEPATSGRVGVESGVGGVDGRRVGDLAEVLKELGILEGLHGGAGLRRLSGLGGVELQTSRLLGSDTGGFSRGAHGHVRRNRSGSTAVGGS